MVGQNDESVDCCDGMTIILVQWVLATIAHERVARMRGGTMKMSKGQFQAKDALLTLALGISTAFIHVAAAPAYAMSTVIESQKDSATLQLSTAQKAKLRSSIKEAMTQLRELKINLQESCELIMSEALDRDARELEPFTMVADTLRQLEAAMMGNWPKFVGMPIIGDEVLALRKSLAVARSRAAQNAMLIKQMGSPVETIETETDISGIGSLATMTSGRLLKLVS